MLCYHPIPRLIKLFSHYVDMWRDAFRKLLWMSIINLLNCLTVLWGWKNDCKVISKMCLSVTFEYNDINLKVMVYCSTWRWNSRLKNRNIPSLGHLGTRASIILTVHSYIRCDNRGTLEQDVYYARNNVCHGYKQKAY